MNAERTSASFVSLVAPSFRDHRGTKQLGGEVAGSKPEVKDRIIEALARRSEPVKAESIAELRDKLELDNVSVTQFVAALGSLAYKPGARCIAWRRFWPDGYANGARLHAVRILPES